MKIQKMKYLTLVFSATLLMTLTACKDDGANGSGSDKFLLTETMGQGPVAIAGPDRTIVVGSSITIDGSSSYDPDGTIVSYTWSLQGRTKSGAVVSYDNVPVGTYTPTLTVEDDDNNKATDTVTITVVDTPNNPPEAQISKPLADAEFQCPYDNYYEQVGGNDTNITFDGSQSSDPDGDALTFAWSGTIEGVSFKDSITDKDQALASIPLKSLCNKCRNQDLYNCQVILNLDVNDGELNDNAQVVFKVFFPL